MPSDTAHAGDTLDLDALALETYSAVYSDVCDALGKRSQTLMPGARRIAGPDCVLIGHARTAISLPVSEIPERPYGGEIDFVDSTAHAHRLQPGANCSLQPRPVEVHAEH